MKAADRQQQIAEAEELLGDRLGKASFAKALFFGSFAHVQLPQYPDAAHDSGATDMAAATRTFCQESIDPAAIDAAADIPRTVIDGLGRLGVLGACLPRHVGGRELSQAGYCRVLEELGGHCGSTALFVNAHHSIGPKALVLFGSEEQQARWLPKLATGEWISAFALTEPQAGSDAANVQTVATPTADGRGFLLNGEKRWITNGGIAQVLTVMARTPASGGSAVTAFIVTPDMPGFEVVEARMDKCGVRGTATAQLAFHDMFVPRENVLGQMGKGLKVALTVLDFGRTTFGASCTGAAKFCLERATRHAATRVQFGQTLGSFELVMGMLARMAANSLAMEACTYQTAALIDAGKSDYMLETAMLKVFSTERLWTIVNDTIQIFGGKAYFRDEPYERMMRDARINLIGEGANDVLRVFVALVGMRDVGQHLQEVLAAVQNPLRNLGRLSSLAGRKIESLFAAPEVPVIHTELAPDAARIGRLVATLGRQVERLLRTHREAILDRQYVSRRIADAATEIYVGTCLLRRMDHKLGTNGRPAEVVRELQTSRYFWACMERHVGHLFDALWSHDDDAATAVANAQLSAREHDAE